MSHLWLSRSKVAQHFSMYIYTFTSGLVCKTHNYLNRPSLGSYVQGHYLMTTNQTIAGSAPVLRTCKPTSIESHE